MSKSVSTWGHSLTLLEKAGYLVTEHKVIGNTRCGRVTVKGLVFTLRAGELSALPIYQPPPLKVFTQSLKSAIEELSSRGFRDWRISYFKNGSGTYDFYLECVLFVTDIEASVLAIHLQPGVTLLEPWKIQVRDSLMEPPRR